MSGVRRFGLRRPIFGGSSAIAEVIHVGRLLSIGTVGTRLLRGRRLDVI